jgi:hypothetical protein
MYQLKGFNYAFLLSSFTTILNVNMFSPLWENEKRIYDFYVMLKAKK